MSKIIAETDNGFLIEIAEYELNVLAYWARYSKPNWKIGREFDFGKMYEQLEGVSKLNPKVKETIKDLEGVIKTLKSINTPSVIFEPTKE